MKAISIGLAILLSAPLVQASQSAEQNSLVRALKTMDHITLQSYSAVFARKQQAHQSVLTKATELLENLSEPRAWASAFELRAPDEAGYCGIKMLKSENSGPHQEWFAKKQACQGQPEKELLRVKLAAGGAVEITLPLYAWAREVAMGPGANNKSTRCQFSFRSEALHRARCEGIHLAAAGSQEVHLEEIIYDQSTSNVAAVSGKLFKEQGISEDIQLTAPSRGRKIFVELVQKEFVTAPTKSPQDGAQLSAKKLAETPAKSEEQILEEMQQLAENWQPWEVQKKVFGDPEAGQEEEAAEAEPSPEEAYASQDLQPRPEEALPDHDEGELEEEGDDGELAEGEAEDDQESETADSEYQEISPLEAAQQLGHTVRPEGTLGRNGY